MSEPIDIVYLWVDGNDPTWRAKRERAVNKMNSGHLDALAVYSNVEGRFRDNDELRYSLRALEKFFPAHGHIYIVTDAQIPSWLHVSDRITVIDHRDLIPEACLPTFDSGNIESYIHRIPNLSERYFYFNDDVFFGAPVNVNDWFSEGGIYVAWSDEPVVTDEPMRADATALENACRLSDQWFKSRAFREHGGDEWFTKVLPDYAHTFRTFAHSPRPMLRSVLFALEEEAADLFAAVRSTVFRTWDKPTIISDFFMRWALAHGIAKTRDYAHLYVSTGTSESQMQLDLLVSSVGELDFFCINDTTDDAHPQDRRLAVVREALKIAFPNPSSFEGHFTLHSRRRRDSASVSA